MCDVAATWEDGVRAVAACTRGKSLICPLNFVVDPLNFMLCGRGGCASFALRALSSATAALPAAVTDLRPER